MKRNYMLLESAKGDAYGSGFEFVKQFIIERDHKMDCYYASRIDNLKAGQYTDDTQMSIAIAELLLNEPEWTPELIAEYFVKVFKRDEREGYAAGFYSVLTSVNSGKELLDTIIPESIRNGAAMRSVPLGLIHSKNELLSKSHMQACITHDTPEGVYSSQAVALMAYYFINNIGLKSGLKDFIEFELFRSVDANKTTRCQCDAVDTVDAVVTVLMNSSSLYEIIDKSVLMGGDTDSVASIACGIASFSSEYDKELPEFMHRDLENDFYGRDYLTSLDKLLMDKFMIK